MTDRRRFCLIFVAAVVSPGMALADGGAPSFADPRALLDHIYREVTAGEGQDGGNRFWFDAPARPLYYTASLVKLWSAADAEVPEGDIKVPSFDLFTDSQDPRVRRVAMTVLSAGRTKAEIDVALFHEREDSHPYATLRFALAREAGGWKIDDVACREKGPKWRLRAMLQPR